MQSEREHLVISFDGKVERYGEEFKGNLFLTNLRIGGIGAIKRISMNKGPVLGGWMVAGLLGATLMALATPDEKEMKKSLKWAITREMRETFSDVELGKFKCNFPIIKAYNINKSLKNISYSIKINYEHQFELKAIGFRITPFKNKKEKKKEFYYRRIAVLNTIEETLIKTHFLDEYESTKIPEKLFLMRISKVIDISGKEIINKICANCKEKNNFKELDNNRYQCLRCGAYHYIRE